MEAPTGRGKARGRSGGRGRNEAQRAAEEVARAGHGHEQQQHPERRPGGDLAAEPPAEPRKPISRGRATTSKPATPGVPPVGGEPGAAASESFAGLQLTERKGGELSRGTMRRRPTEDIATRPKQLVSKLGTSGRQVVLQANFFELMKRPEWALYQHRVDFQPEEDRTSVRKGLLYAHKDTLGGGFMFDGTVLYTTNRLANDPFEIFSCKKGREQDEKVRIIIKFTNQVLPGDMQYIQFFNIILRKCIASLNLQLVGRDYYDAAAKASVQEFNFEVWPGIVTSIRQHENNVLMNIDISHKIMRRETAMDLLNETMNKHGRDRYQEHFTMSIVGATVITLYNNKTYRVDDVDWSMTPVSTFKKGDRDVTFESYYRDRYNLNVRIKNQPLLVSRPKARDIRGGRDTNILLIPELCNLTGLTDPMRSNFQLMKALAEHTRIRPSQRMAKYANFLQRLRGSEKANDELKQWNLKFSQSLVEIQGRILDNESIILGNNHSVKTDKDADWTRSLRGSTMVSVNPLANWCIIYARKNAQDIGPFVQTLKKSASGINYPISDPKSREELPDDRAQSYVSAIEGVINRHNPSLIMCIVPNNKADRYAAIKKKCCIDRAVPSQVVLAKNLNAKGVMSIATKIAIQLNCKIGGGPWTVAVPFKIPAMMVGFDVCHDSLAKGRSYGAMVASLNASYTRYYSAVSPHTTGEELSNDLSLQICKALVKFKTVNDGNLPSRVILYRDGVGDGNLNYVFSHEVELIKAKLREVYHPVEPLLAVVIVSKRINTRMFYKGDNPPPGTVADDVITVPDKYDFFIVSQSVRQGTVSPTSYNVIYDNAGLTPDIMQRLTYKMTHLYFNWSGTVRVPAPCQYAHKLAFLVGQHLHKQPSEALSDLLYFL